MIPQDYRTEKAEIAGVSVIISTYQIGDTYYCKIQNADPGATIVRAESKNRSEALEIAKRKAEEKLSK